MLAVLFLVILVASIEAFAPPNVRSTTSSLFMQEKSDALPFDKRPDSFDFLPELAGDRGFDPAGFTNTLPKQWLIGGEERSIKWYREAEIVHSRVAMLAVIGNLFPAIYHFPGNGYLPEDTFSALNPYTALTQVPGAGLWQISLIIFGIELQRTKRIIRGDKEPGDLGLGQTGFNPFGFDYTEEEYFEKQEQEIKHGRLAMFGALGMLLQAKVTGMGITEQLGGAFSFPETRGVPVGPGYLGDYFPPGL
jgi:hypothetical protein